MSHLPLIMSAESVLATLAGRKTQTRRVLRPKVGGLAGLVFSRLEGRQALFVDPIDGRVVQRARAAYLPGDTLWVREQLRRTVYNDLACYAADNVAVLRDECWATWAWGERQTISPMLMPRWASRLTLRVTEVRVQELHAITDADAIAEGVRLPERTSTLYDGIYRAEYARWWDRLNVTKTRYCPWAENWWVAAYTYERID